jgi:hypothetical protein
MTIRLLILFLCLNIIQSYAQFAKDTLKNFSLHYSSIGGKGSYIVKIDAKGNVIANVTNVGDKLIGEKKISLDKNTFRQFKNIIITQVGFYTMNDRKISHCKDCNSERLEITTDKGTKIIEGHLLRLGSENARILFDTLENMVGFIGRTDSN